MSATYRLRSGELVTSQDGTRPTTYANRTQAERAAAKIAGADLIQRGRPFYVRVPAPEAAPLPTVNDRCERCERPGATYRADGDVTVRLCLECGRGTTTAFSELDGDVRMAFLTAIDAAGAGAFHYYGPFVSVQVPCIPDGLAALDAIAARFDLTRPDDGYFFPLGSDQPAARLRWDGNYPGSKGFTLTVNYRPAVRARVLGDYSPLPSK